MSDTDFGFDIEYEIDIDGDGIPDVTVTPEDTNNDEMTDLWMVDLDNDGETDLSLMDNNHNGIIDSFDLNISYDGSSDDGDSEHFDDFEDDGDSDYFDDYDSSDDDNFVEPVDYTTPEVDLTPLDFDLPDAFDDDDIFDDDDSDDFDSEDDDDDEFDEYDSDDDVEFDAYDEESSDTDTIDFDDDAGRIYGSPWESAEVWEFQGETSRCAIYSQKFVIEEVTGQDIPADELAELAEENGWFSEECGTPVEDMNKLLDHYGVENEVSYYNDMNDIEECLTNGGKVIVSIDSDEIWFGEQDSLFTPGDGVNHAVEVIGVDHTDPENPVVILNDSGHPSGQAYEVPLEVFEDAWEDGNNHMIACE